VDPDGTVRLLGAILTGVPALPAAACRRRAGLFDDRHDGEDVEQRQARLESAAAVCRGCPAQPACRSTLAPARWGGIGVQAGQVLT
jgi:hypothetical protein